MRSELALILLGLALSFSEAVAAFDPEPPRSVDGGIAGLQQWFEKNAAMIGGIGDSADLDGDAKLVLAVRDPYSGVSAVDAYIYGCSPRNCTLIACRYYIRTNPRQGEKKALHLEISKDRKRATVQSRDAIEISIALPPKQ